MLIMVALIAATFVLGYLFTTRQEELTGERTPLVFMGVQIICGDCCGDGELPGKTYLNRTGNCDRCGGHSYILASDLALHALHKRAMKLAENQSAPTRGRVIPFEIPEQRANRDNKIAV